VKPLWAVLPSRTAEEAVRMASAVAGRCGVVVTPGLLAGPGPAVVAALAAIAPVIVLSGLHGDPTDAAVAARRLVEYGATLVTVQAVDGDQLMGAVVEAVGGERVMAVTVWPGRDDASVAASRLGASRGRVVSRLASEAATSGVGSVLCSIGDLGVVHQVASGLQRFVWGIETPDRMTEALERGAAGVITAVIAGKDAAAALDAFG